MLRKRVNPRRDRRVFARSAVRIHKKNLSAGPMRGGIRL